MEDFPKHNNLATLRVDLALFKEPFYWLTCESQKIHSPEGVLRYFSFGLFREPKWLFSQCV